MEKNDLLNILSPWEHLGVSEEDEMSIVFGADQPFGPNRRLHVVNHALTENDFEISMQGNTFLNGFTYPNCLRSFNGSRLFRSKFTLFGFHPPGEGSVSAGLVPPNIVIENLDYSDLREMKDRIRIGTLRSDKDEWILVEEKSKGFSILNLVDFEVIKDFATLKELVQHLVDLKSKEVV